MTIDPEDNMTSGGNTSLVDGYEGSFDSYFQSYIGLGKYEEEQCPNDDEDDVKEVHIILRVSNIIFFSVF